jgi:hypothetical protein
MALCFTGTSAPLAARHMQILPINQYARWLMMFEVKGSGPLDGIMFHSEQCASCVGICLVYALSEVSSSYQLHQLFALSYNQ